MSSVIMNEFFLLLHTILSEFKLYVIINYQKSIIFIKKLTQHINKLIHIDDVGGTQAVKSLWTKEKQVALGGKACLHEFLVTDTQWIGYSYHFF